MGIMKDIVSLNTSAKKVHGSDISILVARAAAFGNDDNLLIVFGENHRVVAADLARVVPGATISENFHPEMNWGDGEVTPAYTTSLVSF